MCSQCSNISATPWPHHCMLTGGGCPGKCLFAARGMVLRRRACFLFHNCWLLRCLGRGEGGREGGREGKIILIDQHRMDLAKTYPGYIHPTCAFPLGHYTPQDFSYMYIPHTFMGLRSQVCWPYNTWDIVSWLARCPHIYVFTFNTPNSHLPTSAVRCTAQSLSLKFCVTSTLLKLASIQPPKLESCDIYTCLLLLLSSEAITSG